MKFTRTLHLLPVSLIQIPGHYQDITSLYYEKEKEKVTAPFVSSPFVRDIGPFSVEDYFNHKQMYENFTQQLKRPNLNNGMIKKYSLDKKHTT